MKKYIVLIFIIAFSNITFAQKDYKTYLKEYRKRCDSVIDYYKKSAYSTSQFPAMAKLAKKHDVENALKAVDSLTLKPRGDMFWFYPMVAMYLYSEKNLPEEYKIKVRNALKSYTPYRGDTENHWMMYYVSLYLAAQTWPNEPGETWFNGKSSQENLEDAKNYLYSWMELTTTVGQGEFDSPIYGVWYVTPLFMLYQFTKDPVMKTKAEIMLDWVLADFFIDYFDNIYTGGNSRLYQYDVFVKRKSQLGKAGAFFFGDKPLFHADGKSWYELYNTLIYALSDYKIPEVLYRIATDRSQPYENEERKRSRNRIRFTTEKNPAVYKYNYITKNYTLGGIQKGFTEQILQHTWNLNWKAIKDDEITTFFTIHPYYSDIDMASLFTSDRKTVVADVVTSKYLYDKEDKWIGSSPYEKLFFNKNVAIGIYDLSSPDVFYKHYDGFFSKDLLEKKEDPSGWIFCRTNSIYFAFYPVKPYIWMDEKEGQRLRSYDEKNGFILECGMPDEFKSFEDFQEKIKKNKIEKDDFNKNLKLGYKSVSGNYYEFSYDGLRKINGQNYIPENYKLFNSPYIQSEIGSQKMELKYKNKMLILDLKNAKITEKNVN
jgi:hypothetical protein